MPFRAPNPDPKPAETIKAAEAKKDAALEKVEDTLKGSEDSVGSKLDSVFEKPPTDDTGSKLDKAFEGFDDDDGGF